MKHLTLTALALFSLHFQTFAGGSVDVAQIQKTLKTQPELAKYLNTTLTFSKHGAATRLGRNWPHLGGARVAPYIIAVTTKNAARTTFELTVICEQTFYDEHGKSLPLKDGEVTDEIIQKTVRVEEKVTSVSLSPAPPEEVEKP